MYFKWLPVGTFGSFIFLLKTVWNKDMLDRNCFSALLQNMPLERSKETKSDWNKISHIDVNLLHENTGDVLFTVGKLSVLMLVSYPLNAE